MTNALTQALGITDKEATVYLLALEQGPLSITQISTKSGINRVTLYELISSLQTRGLILESAKGKRRVFYAAPPELLKRLLGEKVEQFDSILPTLASMASHSQIKPRITYLEGIQGIKDSYRRGLTAKDDLIFGFVGFEALTQKSQALAHFFEDEYIPKRKEYKKMGRIITPDNEIGKAYRDQDNEHYRETRLVPANRYNFELEIQMYDNTVAIMSYTKDEEFALLIESKALSNTVKMIWQIVWASAY